MFWHNAWCPCDLREYCCRKHLCTRRVNYKLRDGGDHSARMLLINAFCFVCNISELVVVARRLSGTGSSAATIRLYIEQYSNDASEYALNAAEVLKPIITEALKLSKLEQLTGRSEPTVIT
jgi:hypothetical protein